MNSPDPLANNLFERLSRFTPRQGAKRKREPLEDYMTEALAFFLLASPAFQEKFVSQVLMLEDLTNNTFDVATQSADAEFHGRADLKMVSKADAELRIGIEVKRYARLQPKQLERMRRGFPHAFLLAPERYLREKQAEIKESGVTPVSLEAVWDLVLQISKFKSEAKPIRMLLNQFSEFLESKGHARVVVKTNPMNANSFTSAARVIDEWTRLLNKVRSELGLDRRGQWYPCWDTPKKGNPDSFYGVYGKGDSYAGFKIGTDGKIFCYYEESQLDRHPKRRLLKEMERDDEKVWFRKTASYPSADEADQSDVLLATFRKLQGEVRAMADSWGNRKA